MSVDSIKDEYANMSDEQLAEYYKQDTLHPQYQCQELSCLNQEIANRFCRMVEYD